MRGFGISGPTVTSGVRSDIEHLLDLFKKCNSLRYAQFFEAFKQMDFHTIFWAKWSVAELVEFSEKILRMAIGYALRKPSSIIEDSSSLLAMEPAPSSSCAGGIVGFQEASGNEESARLVYSQATRNETALQERLFGLYLAYTLYVTQPHRYVVQINITIEELEEIQRFLQHELIPERHYDAIAILQYLTARHIFRIVAFSKDFDVLLHHRYDRYIFDEGDEKKSREEEQPSEQLNSLQAIRNEQLTAQVETIHKWYMETKATAGLTEVNMVRSISEIFDDVQRQMERNVSDEQSGGTSSSHKNAMRSELKAKAFKSQAESARSRRLGRGKTDGGASVGEGGEKAATASETTSKVGRDLDILYSVNVDDLMKPSAEPKSPEKSAKAKKRRRMQSPSEAEKLLQADSMPALDTAGQSTSAENVSTPTRRSPRKRAGKSEPKSEDQKQTDEKDFVLLSLGEGGADASSGSKQQPTKTRLPEEAIKASVNVGKSKEERRGDAILKKLAMAQQSKSGK